MIRNFHSLLWRSHPPLSQHREPVSPHSRHPPVTQCHGSPANGKIPWTKRWTQAHIQSTMRFCSFSLRKTAVKIRPLWEHRRMGEILNEQLGK